MGYRPAGFVHRLFKSPAIGLVEHAVGAPEYFGALLVNTGAEAVNVTGNFDLFAQRQVLDALDNGFGHGHRELR